MQWVASAASRGGSSSEQSLLRLWSFRTMIRRTWYCRSDALIYARPCVPSFFVTGGHKPSFFWVAVRITEITDGRFLDVPKLSRSGSVATYSKLMENIKLLCIPTYIRTMNYLFTLDH